MSTRKSGKGDQTAETGVAPITSRRLCGLLEGEIEIAADIVEVDFADDWEAMHAPPRMYPREAP